MPNPVPTDVAELRRRLAVETRRLGLEPVELGVVADEPIVLLRAPPGRAGPRLLVAAGFHGEEPAGCWGILRFLERSADLVASMSFLPIVNPTGIRAGRRVNDWGENPNAGFCHPELGRPDPSREGAILMRHADLLTELGRDGFVSLHEDIEEREFYLYTFEESAAPGPFSAALVDVERRFFSPKPDGVVEGATVRGGVIFRHCDSSFEDLLFHRGVPRTACTETPGLEPFARRVEANCAIVERVLEFATAETNEG